MYGNIKTDTGDVFKEFFGILGAGLSNKDARKINRELGLK